MENTLTLDPKDEHTLAGAAVSMDINSSPAFSLLSDLLAQGELNKSEAEELKKQYELLHSTILQMYEEEKTVLKLGKQLNQDLLAEKIKHEKLSIRKHEDGQAMLALEKERESTDAELAQLEDATQKLTIQYAELERHKQDLERSVEDARKENTETVEPQLGKAREKCNELEEELARLEQALEEAVATKASLTKSNEELIQATEELGESKQQLKQYLNKIKAYPDRIRKQADVVEAAAVSLQAESAQLVSQIENCDREIQRQAELKNSVSENGRELNRKLDLHRSTIEQRERDVDSVRKSLDLEKAKQEDLNARRVQLEMLLKEERNRLKQATAESQQKKKQFEEYKKLLKKRQGQVDLAKATLPGMEAALVDATSTRYSFTHENTVLAQKVNVLKQEVDIFIANFLRQENLDKETREALGNLGAEIKQAEKQIALWIEEEFKQSKQLSLLGAQREIKAREASKAAALHKSTVQELKIKELTLLDLTKRLTETNNKLREFSALYDVVKNERNKNVNLIQASSQALAEMREKIKILENEVDILRNVSVAKDKALTKERVAHQTAQCQRDNARTDMNKSLVSYKQRQNQVEQQIVEIDKLNSIINNMERSMLKLKKRYELAVEHRNFTGVQLIDRNDELCILYEKSNIQVEALKRGQVALREKEEEVRLVKLDIAEIERGLQSMRRRVPQGPEQAERILKLKHELALEKQLTEQLCQELETPENNDRWRALVGEDPDIEQLQAKLQILEERLNAKKEAHLEKELVLEEVTELSQKLKDKANQGRQNTLELSKSVNAFQARIKEITRKMMALVSELSMYQATAIKLEQDKVEKDNEVKQAELRLSSGQAPFEEAEYEWFKIERQISEKQQAKQSRNPLLADANDPMQSQKLGAKKTTATLRPNAYIPDDDLGIPKPYGALAPFKPSDSGSTMRHIRKPQPKEIEI